MNLELYRTGSVIDGKLRLERLIAAGGGGAVFEASHVGLATRVAVKVLRPGIEDELPKAIETYEWAAAHAEAYGGEIQRLRPRLVVAQFKQWTARELDLQREAASASELHPRRRLAANRTARTHDGVARRYQAQRS